MKNKMILITMLLLFGFTILLSVFVATRITIIETITITIGVTLYHFAMRLIVGTITDLIMKNKADYNNLWFREKKFERKLYKLLHVKSWKKYLPTYNPDTFDTNQKTVTELLCASCQAEIVHEIIMVLSLLPIALIPCLGSATAFILTSICAMLFDSMFVILQRYNRPRLIRIMERVSKIK